MEDINELISIYKNTNPHAFAMRYSQSSKFGTIFYKEVDSLIGHLYDYYGGRRFKPIFDDLISPIGNIFNSIDDVIDSYAKSNRVFMNSYISSMRSSAEKGKEFYNSVQLYLSMMDIPGTSARDLGKALYDYRFNDDKNKICKMCDSPVAFKNFALGYSSYCSATCARKDGYKTPIEQRKIAAEKRKVTMNKIFNDPVLSAQYKKSLSEANKKRYQDPNYRERQSIAVKGRILRGEWTPKITNSWTHWDINIEGKKFRSSWEGIFYIYETMYKGNDISYETLRIPYFNEKNRIYIVDFIDDINKVVYEIKPDSNKQDINNIIKQQYLEEWCVKNSYMCISISDNEIQQYFNQMLSDDSFDHPFLLEVLNKYPKWKL